MELYTILNIVVITIITCHVAIHDGMYGNVRIERYERWAIHTSFRRTSSESPRPSNVCWRHGADGPDASRVNGIII
jgi:hypothetical protein